MAILSLVPVVGTSLVWLPAGLYLLAHKDYSAGIGLLLWGAIVISHIDQVVRPLLGKKLGNINPIVMMLGAFAGLEFFGIVGVVLGPFLLAFFFLLLQVYRQEYLGHPVPLTRAEILMDSSEEEE
jgi:predicted PurR-regulated permease PerM